jgi:hypothetical protein
MYAAAPKVEDNPPNRILKLNGVPQDATSEALQSLFATLPGFKVLFIVCGSITITMMKVPW